MNFLGVRTILHTPTVCMWESNRQPMDHLYMRNSVSRPPSWEAHHSILWHCHSLSGDTGGNKTKKRGSHGQNGAGKLRHSVSLEFDIVRQHAAKPKLGGRSQTL